MGYEQPLTGAERARRWRQSMRAKGLRPRVLWVPDTTTPEYKEQARLASEALTRWHERHPDYIDELHSLQYWPDDDG
jgi:DNA-binding LacI/PurR family transcriptional regulator